MEAGRQAGVSLPVRVATRSDLAGLTDTIWRAFEQDPLWSWAFPDRRKLAPWWRFWIGSALRYPSVSIAGDFAAVAVWIPPGGSELTEQQESEVGPLLEELVGARATSVMALLERFDSSHPEGPPHHYLSLLGTHPEHRGAGVGMGLLAANLAAIDEEGLPAYLESSNPDNNARYERLGFERIGEFSTPDDSRRVATMWREPRPPASGDRR
jgi:GNAT superfamily N-acetyltransferase